MRRPLPTVAPTPAERALPLPGDAIVPDADVVMDRAFTVPGGPGVVWPWFVQLGKRRGGWYMPRWAEWWIPRARRPLRRVEPALQDLAVGTVIPDWGGRDATFEVAEIDPPRALVHRSRRGRVEVSWAIVLTPAAAGTRVHLRLRLGPVRRRRLIALGGGAVDLATIALLAGGLRERLAAPGGTRRA